MTANAETVEESRKALALMDRAQGGDRGAFDELRALGEAFGINFTEFWLSEMVLNRFRDRAAKTNLLARDGIVRDVERVSGDLAGPGDGPIERLIIGRAALCSADMTLAERDYQHAAGPRGDVVTAEALDRRRERSQRMLLAALRALAAVRRMNGPAAVQVNVGDGNVNVLRA